MTATALLTEHPTLTLCPCGNDAVWYFVLPWPVPDAEEIVKVLRIDDLYEDLCPECFNCWVPPRGREGWIKNERKNNEEV